MEGPSPYSPTARVVVGGGGGVPRETRGHVGGGGRGTGSESSSEQQPANVRRLELVRPPRQQRALCRFARPIKTGRHFLFHPGRKGCCWRPGEAAPPPAVFVCTLSRNAETRRVSGCKSREHGVFLLEAASSSISRGTLFKTLYLTPDSLESVWVAGFCVL